jgi:GntR family transcriptional regulator/MocR family aminotransferase
MRTIYSERFELFCRAIADRLGRELEIKEADSGLHVTVWLTRKKDDVKLAREILRQGVEVRPLSWFYRGGNVGRGLVLGHTGYSAREIKDGVRRMAKAF